MATHWFTRLTAASAGLQGLRNETVHLVKDNMLQISTHSWELGTAAQALTETFTPGLSVFESSAFPPPSELNTTWTPTDVFAIVENTLSDKPASSGPLFANQGSAADPASLGTAVLLANWTRQDLGDLSLSRAAGGQLDYLLNDAPRADSGAISHRSNYVQLWSDFVYMVPPFLAYYGALEGSAELLQEAYDQCRLYRDGLQGENGLWRHIELGTWQDETHWATGNGWAAAGMLRVLSSMNHSSVGEELELQQANLTTWVQEILEESWLHQNDDGSVNNVIDDPETFADNAATALLAASTYRFATLTGDVSLIPFADKAFEHIASNINVEGWLEGVVDPQTFHELLPEGEYSPEGQAFTLLLHAARKAFAHAVATEAAAI